MPDRGKNANLVDCIVNLSIREVDEFDLLESINSLVDEPLNFIDTGVSSFSKFSNYLEIIH